MENEKHLVIGYHEYENIINYLDGEIEELERWNVSEDIRKYMTYEWARMRLLVKLAWYKGHRISELIKLKAKDIRMVNNSFGKTKMEFYLHRRKGKKRGTYVHYDGFEPWNDIVEYKKKYNVKEEEYLIGSNYNNKSKHIAISTTYNKIAGIFNALKMNRSHLGWHGFRRGRATFLADRKIPLESIQRYLLHEDKKTTQRYIKSSLCTVIDVEGNYDNL